MVFFVQNVYTVDQLNSCSSASGELEVLTLRPLPLFYQYLQICAFFPLLTSLDSFYSILFCVFFFFLDGGFSALLKMFSFSCHIQDNNILLNQIFCFCCWSELPVVPCYCLPQAQFGEDKHCKQVYIT